MNNATPIMVSACLLGIRCRYDGRHSRCAGVVDLLASLAFVPFCPEQMGGLATPRPPATIVGGDGGSVLSGRGRVVNDRGIDVTGAFRKGAEEALHLATLAGCTVAIMKDRSPSCGLRTPYCEDPSGFGRGITASLFASEGIRMIEPGSDGGFPAGAFLKLLEEASRGR